MAQSVAEGGQQAVGSPGGQCPQRRNQPGTPEERRVGRCSWGPGQDGGRETGSSDGGQVGHKGLGATGKQVDYILGEMGASGVLGPGGECRETKEVLTSTWTSGGSTEAPGKPGSIGTFEKQCDLMNVHTTHAFDPVQKQV